MRETTTMTMRRDEALATRGADDVRIPIAAGDAPAGITVGAALRSRLGPVAWR